MEFTEIENHDDFYSVDENGFVHVQDQRGFYIVYDVSLSDLKYNIFYTFSNISTKK